MVGTTTVSLTGPTGSGTDTLEFAYPVLSGDQDTDGVSVPANALALGISATLVGSANLAADLTHGAKTFPERRVNPPAPEVTGIAITSDPNDDGRAGDDDTYAIGDTVEVTVTFSKAVVVDTTNGTPELELDVGGTPEGAEYASGSGSTALVFEYDVAVNDAAPDGIAIGADKLTLEGGTIKAQSDSVDAVLDHDAVAADDGHRADGVRPTLASAETSLDGTKVILTFNEAIASTTGNFNVINAQVAGTGGTVVNGTVEVPLQYRPALHGDTGFTVGIGADTVRDLAGNGNLTSSPFQQPITVTVPQPPAAATGVAITSPAGADMSHATGTTVEITATFDTEVDVTGTPRIRFGLVDGESASRRWADFDRGGGTTGLVFAYEVAATDESDTNGILVHGNTLELNGGTIRKAGTTDDAQLAHASAGNDETDPHRVNWVRPAFASAGTSTDGARVVVTFSEALGPDSFSETTILSNGLFTVKVEGTATTLTVVSQSGSTVTLTLDTAVTAGQTVTVSYADPSGEDHFYVEDLAANDAESFTDEMVTNNVAAAGIASIALTSDPDDDGRAGNDSTYAIGDTVQATVTFSEAVTVGGSGTARLPLIVRQHDRKTVAAEHVSTSTDGTALLFAYEVVEGDAAVHGISIAANSLVLNGATIKAQSDDRDAVLTHAGVPLDDGHRVDGVRPKVDFDTSYIEGGRLELYWSEPPGPGLEAGGIGVRGRGRGRGARGERGFAPVDQANRERLAGRGNGRRGDAHLRGAR